MKNNKKGISAVVATVLIILITVAAVTIIWAAIIPMINDQLSRGTICLDAMTALSIENKGYTCYHDGVDVDVQVGHGSSDVGLVAIQILISDEDGNTASFMMDNASKLPGLNGARVITVPYDAGTPSFVSIAPVVKVGEQEETCDASTAVTLELC